MSAVCGIISDRSCWSSDIFNSRNAGCHSNKETVKIKLADKSGRYLLDTGYNWWLKDKSGKRIGGFNYIKVPAGKGLSSGYYMFDKRRPAL